MQSVNLKPENLYPFSKLKVHQRIKAAHNEGDRYSGKSNQVMVFGCSSGILGKTPVQANMPM